MFRRSYTADEKKILLAKCIQVGIDIAFQNHIYWYHSEMYRQLEGGVIGARLTAMKARVVMDRWGVKVEEYVRYMVSLTFTFALSTSIKLP